MNILLTGSTGYIGKRLLYALVPLGHHLFCCVRDKNRFEIPAKFSSSVTTIEVDFLNQDSLTEIPKDIDVAFYLIHSMSASSNYESLEQTCAENFKRTISKTNVKQVVYLWGIINDKDLSKHLTSRKNVESVLVSDSYALTTLRAGIIIGSGSASFEIIRDLVEKLPIMVTPRWLNTRCQPIGISDVIKLLLAVILDHNTYDKSFDIGGADILTYKEMLLAFAKVRGLKRVILTTPFMTPKLSSYWLYFVTSTSYKLAKSLVSSMKVEVICDTNQFKNPLHLTTESYQTSLEKAFKKIDTNNVVSSWKDAFISGDFEINITDYINVPTHGCFIDQRKMTIQNPNYSLDRIWSIGGNNGWYYANILWKIRGVLDKAFGGVGLRRGRTNASELSAGDSIDFWRVLYANKKEGRLLLFAEMKLPGDAWLEFKLINNILIQTATFRPRGLLGRLYWYSVKPFHYIVFQGLIEKLAEKRI